MAARKTAAQKAAEAAERDEYTGTGTAAPEEDANLTDVRDDKGRRLTVQQLKNKLRNEAEREVLDTHKAEVVTITAAKYKVHNLEYVRRLTEEEKAAKAIEEYYEKFPNLRPQPPADPPHDEPALVKAEPGGALDQFREANGAYDPEPAAVGYTPYDGDSEYPEEGDLPDKYREVEAREGE
jgi:hypothetical protein